jgi:hypothetical protein
LETQFIAKMNRFAALWGALVQDYNEKKVFNIKLAGEVTKAFHDIEASDGWLKPAGCLTELGILTSFEPRGRRNRLPHLQVSMAYQWVSTTRWGRRFRLPGLQRQAPPIRLSTQTCLEDEEVTRNIR